MREFAESDGIEFSSFAELVGVVRSLDIVFSNGRQADPESVSALVTNFDAVVIGWCSLLPPSKRKLLRSDGTVDEQLFRANMLINT